MKADSKGLWLTRAWEGLQIRVRIEAGWVKDSAGMSARVRVIQGFVFFERTFIPRRITFAELGLALMQRNQPSIR
jgi:hypothetical protein